MVWQPKFPIVGIGASAGGIPAMEGLFRGLPAGSGIAFVIVTHLSPERESLLHEVIARYTDLPVVVAEDGMEVRPDIVYVMPHNAILTIQNATLKLRQPNSVARERKPVDIFFSALAEAQEEHAVGIVLSGGDFDGTLGVKAIKEHGGLTLAQVSDGSGPRNPAMPQSAIASGLIDIAVPADEMGEKLAEFVRSFEVLDELVRKRTIQIFVRRGTRSTVSYAVTRDTIFPAIRPRPSCDASSDGCRLPKMYRSKIT